MDKVNSSFLLTLQLISFGGRAKKVREVQQALYQTVQEMRQMNFIMVYISQNYCDTSYNSKNNIHNNVLMQSQSQ